MLSPEKPEEPSIFIQYLPKFVNPRQFMALPFFFFAKIN